MIKSKSKSSNNNELISLSDEIKNLEIRKNQIISEVMGKIQKTVKEWSKDISSAHFNECIKHLFTERFNKREGTDYFSWTSNEKIQKDFEIFVERILKNEEKFFLNKNDRRFFTLKKFVMKSTSRSSVEFDSYKIDEDGRLVYNYSGTAYHGFGSVDNTVQQELVINLEKMCIERFEDSTRQYHSRDSGSKKIDCSFIKKLIK